MDYDKLRQPGRPKQIEDGETITFLASKNQIKVIDKWRGPRSRSQHIRNILEYALRNSKNPMLEAEIKELRKKNTELEETLNQITKPKEVSLDQPKTDRSAYEAKILETVEWANNHKPKAYTDYKEWWHFLPGRCDGIKLASGVKLNPVQLEKIIVSHESFAGKRRSI